MEINNVHIDRVRLRQDDHLLGFSIVSDTLPEDGWPPMLTGLYVDIGGVSPWTDIESWTDGATMVLNPHDEDSPLVGGIVDLTTQQWYDIMYADHAYLCLNGGNPTEATEYVDISPIAYEMFMRSGDVEYDYEEWVVEDDDRLVVESE